MSKIKDKLTEARKLIEHPRNLIKCPRATNGAGREVSVDAPDAVCFTAAAACVRVAGGDYYLIEEMFGALGHVVRKTTSQTRLDDDDYVLLGNYNKTHDHQSVLKVFDQAIAACAAAPKCSVI